LWIEITFQSTFEIEIFGVSRAHIADDPTWDATHYGEIGYVRGHDRTGIDPTATAHRDARQNQGACPDEAEVTNFNWSFRVTWSIECTDFDIATSAKPDGILAAVGKYSGPRGHLHTLTYGNTQTPVDVAVMPDPHIVADRDIPAI
jgi:hypothetical protein